ncbi:MAG: hypothetical protein ACMG6S_08090 [Byssovorax sp.]
MSRAGGIGRSRPLACLRMIAVRCALLALVAVLGSCKTSCSSTDGSRVVIGLGMTLAEVKASCPDPFDVNHRSEHDDTVTSTRLHPVVILGLGQNIEFRDCSFFFTMHDGRVNSIRAFGPVGPANRRSATAVFDSIGEHLILDGWRAYPPESPQHRTYGRDRHTSFADVRLGDITGTDAAKMRNMSEESWVIELFVVESSNRE